MSELFRKARRMEREREKTIEKLCKFQGLMLAHVVICLLLLLLQNTHARTSLCCNNCIIFAYISQTDSISVLEPHKLFPPYFFQRITFFLHCLTADVNTWVVQRVEGGWRNPGVGDEGKKWQGFREGGITQWAGSPAGGGIDGYLNRPPQSARLALQWARGGLSFCQEVICGGGGEEGLLGEGTGGGEGAEPARLDNAKTHMHIQTHPLS